MITREQLERIKDAQKIQNEIKSLSIADKELGFDLPIRDFIRLMQMLTAQSYGARIQNRFIRELGLKKVPASANTGDCIDNMGDFYEVKCSIITVTNTKLNFVQIRPWQKIKGYFGIAIDTRFDPANIEVYRLDKNQMANECEKMGASSAHGTKEANQHNENKELRFDLTIDIDDPDYIRWQNYRSNYQF